MNSKSTSISNTPTGTPKIFTFNETAPPTTEANITSPSESMHSYDSAYLKNRRPVSRWTPTTTPKQVPLTVLPCSNSTPSSSAANLSDISSLKTAGSRLPPAAFISTIKPIASERQTQQQKTFSHGKSFNTPNHKFSPANHSNRGIHNNNGLVSRSSPRHMSPKINLSPRNRIPGLNMKGSPLTDTSLNVQVPRVPNLQLEHAPQGLELNSNPRPPNIARLFVQRHFDSSSITVKAPRF